MAGALRLPGERHGQPSRRNAALALTLCLLAALVPAHAQQCDVTCPDLDATGTVQVSDLLLLLGAYGMECPATPPARFPPA